MRSMKAFRRLAWAFGLAAALLLGQQLASLHDLKHATEQLTQKDSKPGSNTCDQCAACAQLSGAASVTPPALPVACATHEPAVAQVAQDADSAPLISFRSRAPPTLL
jgi:hypothetical protein